MSAELLPLLNNRVTNSPGSAGKTICGATTDWLIMVNEDSDISLSSKLTGAQIQLPRISSSLHQRQCSIAKPKTCVVHKAVLSSDPDRFSDYIVMIIYGEAKKLAYHKSGNGLWTLLQEAGSYYDDVITHKGKLYAVDEYGKVVICEPHSSMPVTELTPPWFLWGQKVYLVSISNNLCLVIRYLKDKPTFGCETYNLKVYTLDFCKKSWEFVRNIGKRTILLGRYHSVTLPSNSVEGLRPDCIYFKDDYADNHKDAVAILGGHDIFVFSLDGDSIEQLLCPSRDLQTIWQQQIVS